ncbi:MAG: hypothetical protein AAF441_26290 [Pseudomonadota bacterium]
MISNATQGLLEFSIVVVVISIMTALIVSALSELFLRAFFNSLVYRSFYQKLPSKKIPPSVFPEPRDLDLWFKMLPYRQFCGRLSDSINLDPYSFDDDPDRELLREIEKIVDDLQSRMGTLWTWFIYYISLIVSTSTVFVFSLALDGMDTKINLEISETGQRFLLVFGALFGGLIAPLGIRMMERLLGNR